jgi:hypothetical protein
MHPLWGGLQPTEGFQPDLNLLLKKGAFKGLAME